MPQGKERGSTVATTAVEPSNETEKVESWRLHVLLKEAGYPLALAEKLAHSQVDLHDAVDLVRKGCEPKLAAEILL